MIKLKTLKIKNSAQNLNIEGNFIIPTEEHIDPIIIFFDTENNDSTKIDASSLEIFLDMFRDVAPSDFIEHLKRLSTIGDKTQQKFRLNSIIGTSCLNYSEWFFFRRNKTIVTEEIYNKETIVEYDLLEMLTNIIFVNVSQFFEPSSKLDSIEVLMIPQIAIKYYHIMGLIAFCNVKKGIEFENSLQHDEFQRENIFKRDFCRMSVSRGENANIQIKLKGRRLVENLKIEDFPAWSLFSLNQNPHLINSASDVYNNHYYNGIIENQLFLGSFSKLGQLVMDPQRKVETIIESIRICWAKKLRENEITKYFSIRRKSMQTYLSEHLYCLNRKLSINEIFAIKYECVLTKNPKNGRCIIMNYDENYDTSLMQSRYEKMGFICPDQDNLLDYNHTVEILKRESKNTTEHCNCLVIVINAKCKKSLCSLAFETPSRHIIEMEIIKEMVQFPDREQDIEQKKLEKHIFINSFLEKNAPIYYYHRKGNFSISFNLSPVNFSIQLINLYNYPLSTSLDFTKLLSEEISTSKTNEQPKQKFRCSLINGLTNTDKSSSVDHFENQTYKNSVYQTGGIKKGHCLILKDDCSKKYKLIQQTFKNLGFKCSTYKEETKPNFIEYLKSENVRGDNEGVDCVFYYIFSDFDKDDMNNLIFNSTSGLGASKLKDVPKLIFVQNKDKMNVSFDHSFPLPDDLLLLICSSEKTQPTHQDILKGKTTFIDVFCEQIKQHSLQYDLLSILHSCIIWSRNLIFIKSTLTKALFFNQKMSKDEIVSIKSDNLFYTKGKRRCLILEYAGADNQYSDAIELLTNKFEKLHFETIKEEITDEIFQQKIANEIMQNHFEYDGFYVFIILDDKANLATIEQFIEHLTGTESLVGKPKVIFLLGSTKKSSKMLSCYEQMSRFPEVKSYKKKNNEEASEEIVLPKHADIMLFQSEHVKMAINSICSIFSEENVNRYDLMKLLLMISANIDAQNCLENQTSAQKFKIVENCLQNECENAYNESDSPMADFCPSANTPQSNFQNDEIKLVSSPLTCINSTATRLISLSSGATNSQHTHLSEGDIILSDKNIGKFVIFNYFKFEDPQIPVREGSENDVFLLKKTFGDAGFEVEDVAAIVKEEMQSELTQQITWDKIKKITCDGQCLFVCFATHGTPNDELYCYDKTIKRDEILECIANNKNLSEKPKFFLFQACRGEKVGKTTKIPYSKMDDFVTLPTSPMILYPDIFAFFATFEDQRAHRNLYDGTNTSETNKLPIGSWFLQQFCKIFNENYKKLDLLTIAVMVCQAVSKIQDQRTVKDEKQNNFTITLTNIPTFYTTLTKSYFFTSQSQASLQSVEHLNNVDIMMENDDYSKFSNKRSRYS